MDRRALERLGHHVVSRRVALGYRNRTDLADSLQFTVRTLADIEHGVRNASPGTYAMLENKLSWAPGSIDTILAGGEPKELVSTLRRTNPNAATQGYALRPTNPNALSQVSTKECVLEPPTPNHRPPRAATSCNPRVVSCAAPTNAAVHPAVANAMAIRSLARRDLPAGRPQMSTPP